eukprot:5352257-Ditylum_brightwellii.AAC.1
MEPTPTITHVKGHQDDTTLYGELDWTSQQNVDADKLAGQQSSAHSQRQIHHWSLYYKDKMLGNFWTLI